MFDMGVPQSSIFRPHPVTIYTTELPTHPKIIHLSNTIETTVLADKQ